MFVWVRVVVDDNVTVVVVLVAGMAVDEVIVRRVVFVVLIVVVVSPGVGGEVRIKTAAIMESIEIRRTTAIMMNLVRVISMVLTLNRYAPALLIL